MASHYEERGIVKDFLMMPVDMIREGEDWIEKAMGALMGVCYAGAAGLLGIIGYSVTDTVKNPTYSFNDTASGTVSRFDVTPTKKFVLQRISGEFGMAADFKEEALCDAHFSWSTTLVPQYTTINNQMMLTGFLPVTSESQRFDNCQSFSEARQTAQGEATVAKMSYYLAQGKAAHGK